MPPGRPKAWRTKAFEVLECAVAQRIEGTRVDEREDNKLWLVRYLELTRQLIIEDLRVVKTLCVPCFPPHYDIVNKYVNMYHTCLSSSVSNTDAAITCVNKKQKYFKKIVHLQHNLTTLRPPVVVMVVYVG